MTSPSQSNLGLWRSSIIAIAFGTLAITMTGCPSSQSNLPVAPSVSEATRPPLRILIQSDSTLHEAIERRWQSISDQRLQVSTLAIENWLETQTPKADILIFESRWLATLADRQRVVALPTELVRSASIDPSDQARAPIDAPWPWVWRQSVSYEQRIWGIPLGVPMMAWLDPNPSPSVHPDSTTTPQTTSAEFAGSPDQAARNRDDWLVDRFLVIAAELNPRSGESSMLFQMNNGRCRLNEPWVVEAAKRLASLASTDRPPSASWDASPLQDNRATLGWPSIAVDESHQNPSRRIRAPKPWVDTGRGLIAVLTKENRQSSTSVRFLRWLDDDIQRLALGTVDPRIQRLADLGTPAKLPPDSRQYMDLLSLGLNDRRSRCELHFAESIPFRLRLENALRDIMVHPELASAAMTACYQDWNALSEKVGADRMKRRLGATYGLNLTIER